MVSLIQKMTFVQFEWHFLYLHHLRYQQQPLWSSESLSSCFTLKWTLLRVMNRTSSVMPRGRVTQTFQTARTHKMMHTNDIVPNFFFFFLEKCSSSPSAHGSLRENGCYYGDAMVYKMAWQIASGASILSGPDNKKTVNPGSSPLSSE